MGCHDPNQTPYHCGEPIERLAYYSRYTLRSGQTIFVIRCRQCRKTFCDRFGTAFYDLKTPGEKVQRTIRQGLEGLCPEAVARVEDVHPTTVQRWIERACLQAKAADREVITGVVTETIELLFQRVLQALGLKECHVKGAAKRLATGCRPL